MRSEDIRKTFIDFFRERGHTEVRSSPLVPDDPTLLLTNAGMVQFKPYFLREVEPPYTRATSVQKCLRTTDIDSVGRTARHTTFFEMLGNFSFGDYYKESAIPWAWELVTSVFGIDPERLWVSVFEDDEEAEGIWSRTLGRAERIIKLGEKDNFWDMGPTGPCGPCSEILYDRGAEYSCSDRCAPGCDCDRFLELWNLVFMQYNREPDGTLNPLPRKNIDTGMGVERLAAIMQGVPTVFETDVFIPIVAKVRQLCASPNDRAEMSVRVVADHARASTFLVADGVIPSNEGRGYVLRRLIRRAVMHGRVLGIDEMFLKQTSEVVIETLSNAYPELEENRELIGEVIGFEEERFCQTLEQGLDLLKGQIERLKEKGETLIDGRTAFYLHDTLGFPLELTEEIARESGLNVDRDSFEALMREQRERARTSREFGTESKLSALYSSLFREKGATHFVGYEQIESSSKVLGMIVGGKLSQSARDEAEVELILDVSPFYPESGGQVGDTGTIESLEGRVAVKDTFYGAPGLIVHRGKLCGVLSVGEQVECAVDSERRKAISRNHSATHILHWALREVLGSHVRQSGSLVAPDRLRFDFTHFRQLSLEEIRRVEDLANLRVLEDGPIEAYETTKEEALLNGAIALFGEKYGERVRVVEMGGFSMELCAGAHVCRTGEIGLVHIVSESGIGSGMRRIEAVTGLRSLGYLRELEENLGTAASILKCRPDELPAKVREITERLRTLEKRSAGAGGESLREFSVKVSREARKETVSGVRVLLGKAVGIGQRELREVADILARLEGGEVIAVASGESGRAHLVVRVSAEAQEKGIDARELAKAGGERLGGGGGGRSDMAVAGGPAAEQIDDALETVLEVVREKMEG